MLAVLGGMGDSRSILRSLGVFGLASGLFGCDVATKSAARATLAEGPIALTSWADLRYTMNDDIGFSALRRLGIPRSSTALFVVEVALAALLLVVVLRARRDAAAERAAGSTRDLALLAGIGCIVSGAVGNAVERLTHGAVTDFIHVHGWPVFNVADIVIVVGFGLVALGWRAAPRGDRTTGTS